MTALDLDLVRAQFPAFGEATFADRPFLENAGGSLVCRQVIERLDGYYRRTKVQPGHPYPISQDAYRAMADGPARLAPWLGVPADHVHVGPSTTQNTYVLARAFGAVLRPGDAVVVTQQDHEANSGPWRRLADRGVAIREWLVDHVTGRLDLTGLDRILDDDVALVAFPHVSNLVGERNDVAAITARVHDAGAVAVVDGVAAAPHGPGDIGALGADVYLFSTYKTYGPHQGVMCIAPELVERLPNEGHFFNADQPRKRLIPAGPDHAQVAALAGIADYLEVLRDGHPAVAGATDPAAALYELWRRHEVGLMEPLLRWLRDHPGLRALGPLEPDERVPTMSIVTPRAGAEVAAALAARGVMCAGGHFYAHRLVSAVGVDPAAGLLRLSAVHYTSRADIDHTLEALDALL